MKNLYGYPNRDPSRPRGGGGGGQEGEKNLG